MASSCLVVPAHALWVPLEALTSRVAVLLGEDGLSAPRPRFWKHFQRTHVRQGRRGRPGAQSKLRLCVQMGNSFLSDGSLGKLSAPTACGE